MKKVLKFNYKLIVYCLQTPVSMEIIWEHSLTGPRHVEKLWIRPHGNVMKRKREGCAVNHVRGSEIIIMRVSPPPSPPPPPPLPPPPPPPPPPHSLLLLLLYYLK